VPKQNCSCRDKMGVNSSAIRRHLIVGTSSMKMKQVVSHLRDYTGLTHRLLTTWAETPMVMMLEEDWEKGPLVLIGEADRMMWPLLPPGSVLRLDPKARKIDDRSWGEFERPIYLVEYRGRFYCCHLQRRGDMLRLIAHLESPVPPRVSCSGPTLHLLSHWR